MSKETKITIPYKFYSELIWMMEILDSRQRWATSVPISFQPTVDAFIKKAKSYERR